jgi:hypothetical protein
VLAELEELGAGARLVAGDPGDPETLGPVLAMFGGKRPLRGVVHAAGVLDDGVLGVLTTERVDAVLRPKLDGAWHLHRSTQDIDLDFFVLFSSVSGVMGLAGQAGHSAADTFLDALAHLRSAKGLPATAIAYGPWQGDGMAAGPGEADRARLERSGLDMLAPAEGLELLELAIAGNRSLTVSAAFDPVRAQRHYAEHGGVPPLLRALTGAYGHDDEATAQADLRTVSRTSCSRPRCRCSAWSARTTRTTPGSGWAPPWGATACGAPNTHHCSRRCSGTWASCGSGCRRRPSTCWRTGSTPSATPARWSTGCGRRRTTSDPTS